MQIHKTFKTEKERKVIIADMKSQGFTQVAVKGYFYPTEGHLLFSDGKPDKPPVRGLSDEIDELKAKVEALEAKQ